MAKLESYDFVLKKLSKLKKWSKNSIRHPSLKINLQTGKTNNARPRARKTRSPKTESEEDQSDDNSDEPGEQPPSKKKKPLTECK